MPDLAAAYGNLGNALGELGKLDDAVASYRNALAVNPDMAETHNNLGNVLRNLGRLEDAVSSFERAVALQPEFAEAHSNLGNLCQDLGQAGAAVANFKKALTLRPDFADAHGNLSLALKELGKLDESFACQRRAVSLAPDSNSLWFGYAQCLDAISFTSVDDSLSADLLLLLERPSVRPSTVICPIIGALRHLPEFSEILEQFPADRPGGEFVYGDVANKL